MFSQVESHKSGKASNFSPSMEVKVLPSKGLAYPKGFSLTYKPYLFGEVKLFNQMPPGSAEAVKLILSGINVSFPREDITLSDFLYVALLRKISSFGNLKFSVSSRCKECGTIGKQSVSSEGMAFDDMQASSLPVIVETSQGDLKFKPITVGDFLKLKALQKELDVLSVYAAMLVDGSKTFEQAREFLFALKAEDEEAMGEMDSVLYHGVKPIPAECGVCKATYEVDIDGSDEAIVGPFRELGQPHKSRVRFSTKT